MQVGAEFDNKVVDVIIYHPPSPRWIVDRSILSGELVSGISTFWAKFDFFPVNLIQVVRPQIRGGEGQNFNDLHDTRVGGPKFGNTR